MPKNVQFSSRSEDVEFDWQAMQALSTGSCFAVVISDIDRNIILSLLRYAYWPTRWVNAPADFLEVTHLISHLEECIMAGCDLSDLGEALIQAAQIIAAGSSRAGGGGGGASCYSSSPILDCLGQYTDAQVLDTSAPPASVHGNTPPEGFESIEVYRTYKCQVAYALIGELITFFRGLQAYSAIVSNFNNVVAWLAGLLAQIATFTVSPSGTAAMAERMMRMLNLAPTVFSVCGSIADYLNDNTDEIACALYKSGSAASAALALAGWLDDAIQSVQWTALFGESVGPQLGALMGELASQFQSNGLTNSLFQLLLDVSLPEADCSACGTDRADWPFDMDAEGWEWTDTSTAPDTCTGAWGTQEPTDPGDESPGHLRNVMTGNTAAGSWNYWFDNPPTAGEDTVFSMHMKMTSDMAATQTRAWIYFDDETSVAAESYYQPDWVTLSVPLVNHAETWGKTITRLSLTVNRTSGTPTVNIVHFDHGALNGTT